MYQTAFNLIEDLPQQRRRPMVFSGGKTINKNRNYFFNISTMFCYSRFPHDNKVNLYFCLLQRYTYTYTSSHWRVRIGEMQAQG